jgi:hypothetical protein
MYVATLFDNGNGLASVTTGMSIYALRKYYLIIVQSVANT